MLLCRLSQKPNTVCWFLGESTAHYGAQSPYCFIWPLKYSNMILWKLQDHLGKMFLDIVLARNQKFWRKIEILMFCHNGTFWHFDMFFNTFSRTHGKLTLRTYLFGHLKEKKKRKSYYNSFLCLYIQWYFVTKIVLTYCEKKLF